MLIVSFETILLEILRCAYDRTLNLGKKLKSLTLFSDVTLYVVVIFLYLPTRDTYGERETITG